MREMKLSSISFSGLKEKLPDGEVKGQNVLEKS